MGAPRLIALSKPRFLSTLGDHEREDILPSIVLLQLNNESYILSAAYRPHWSFAVNESHEDYKIYSGGNRMAETTVSIICGREREGKKCFIWKIKKIISKLFR